MRVKTDQKRRAILAAAVSVLEEMGHAGASMSAIAARLGGSKATIYGYFSTKEELFAAAMTEALRGKAVTHLAKLDADGDIEADLLAYGHAYLDFIALPELVALARLALSEAGTKTSLGVELMRQGLLPAMRDIADRLERRAARGELVIPDPLIAAYHLKGLLDAGVFEPRLHGEPPLFDRCVVVRSAVDVFLSAYGAPAARCHGTIVVRDEAPPIRPELP